jgi:hypothetical protein
VEILSIKEMINMLYKIRFELMEMVELVYAIKYALGKEHDHFLMIYEWNVKGIEALRRAREKILAGMHDNYEVELDLIEIVQLYSAVSMAWHHEKDEMERQHTECRLEQYARAISELEMAREKILAAMKGVR